MLPSILIITNNLHTGIFETITNTNDLYTQLYGLK